VPFGAATFVFDDAASRPTRIEFRYPSLHMALLERGQRLSGAGWERAGVYFLLGPGDSSGTYQVYVGKSPAGVASRIVQHEASKDWWDRALVVVAGRLEGFTSAEVAWLEAEFVARLRANVGQSVANRNQPTEGTLPSYMLPELEAQIHPIEAVLRLLGVLTTSSEPQIVTGEAGLASPEATAPASSRTWLEAALLVLPEDGSPMHVKSILEEVRHRGLREFGDARTPDATLRRDLRINAQGESPKVAQTAPATFARITRR